MGCSTQPLRVGGSRVSDMAPTVRDSRCSTVLPPCVNEYCCEVRRRNRPRNEILMQLVTLIDKNEVTELRRSK